MNANALKSSPLGGYAPFQGINTRIEEIPFVGKLTLRGEASNSAFLSGVARVLGVNLPVTPNKTVNQGGNSVSWVGPNEWLIHTPEGDEAALAHSLKDALVGLHSSIVDVSDYYTVISVTGSKARDVLAKGCPLDLHPSTFGPGDCAGSVFIKAVIHLVQNDDAPRYSLQVRWSMAEYLWRNLIRAAQEWG